jgi:hypothetical protein
MANDNYRDSPTLTEIVSRAIREGPELVFIIDLVKKALVFFVLLFVAVLCNLGVNLLNNLRIHWVIVNGLFAVEIALFLGDAVWFVSVVSISTYSQISSTLKAAKSRSTLPASSS